ncbi:hypothetical protein VNI00_009831 [Paramarasmius palmivorus]|uniref:Uncharacterized protein n=1 Tax=Paramarasmius palmivorus TaxID=297713 RepID=A0AAW0CNW8_9AGAR
MFESTLQLIYTIVLPKPSFKVPPSKPDPIYHTASNLPTQYSPFDVSRSQTRLNPATPRRRARSSCPYDTQNRDQSLPYHLPGLEFMSAESPARQTPLHSTPKRTPVQESPTRSKKPRRHSTTSLGSPYVGSTRKAQSKSNKENIPPSKFETPPRNPTRRSGSSNDRNLPKRPIPTSPSPNSDPEKKLRRSSGRIASYGSGQSFVKALKRSVEDSSSETEPEREPSTNPAATTSIQPFTLELSPILEDLAVFDSVGTNLNLSALGSLDTIGARREQHDVELMPFHIVDETPSASAPPKSVKPSLVLQRASLALAAPALTLTKPTPELESIPVFEDLPNPVLTSISPMLTPIPDLHADSISSLSLSPSHTSLSPSFLPSTRTPAPLPAFPRCTTCGFGFGTGFDLNASMDMLDVSRLPCGECEGEWERCVGWFGERGFARERKKEEASRSKRVSWFRKEQDQEQEEGKRKTFSFKKRFSSSFSFARKKSSSTPVSMPVVTVTRVRVEEDDHDGFEIVGAQVSPPKKIKTNNKRFSTSTSPSDPRERRPLSSSFLDHKRFSGLFAPKSEKRYSSVGVQTGECEGEGGREAPPVRPRVSTRRESRFIEDLGCEEEGEREAMDALQPLRWRYL